MQSIDTLITADWVIPVEPANVALPRHAIAIDKGRIADILPAADAASRYQAAERIDLPGHVLIPGLINLHTHAAMTLMRGLADDLPLMQWLNDNIWPVELRLASPEFVHDGTLLACAEMLRGGVTCFNDMYFFPEAAARAAISAGMRAALGMIVVEFRSPYANDATDYLNKGLALRDELKGESLISFCFAPHAPFTVTDSTLERVATYAGELDVPVHIHLHETSQEVQESIAAHGVRPLHRLQKLGLMGLHLIAVHAVHLTEEEIGLLAHHACHVAHCPSSNLKLGSGIAPIARLRKRGVNIGLGTDGAASNNRLDLVEEMRLAALLAKGSSGDPTSLPAPDVLEMATLGGARALGLDQSIGSLVPGKQADIVAVDLSDPELAPCYDPLSHLAYVVGREHVRHVWVGGRQVVKNGALTRLDARELSAKAWHWKERIKS